SRRSGPRPPRRPQESGWTSDVSHPLLGSEHRQVELLLAGDLAELVLGAGLDLADALLGDPQLAAELLEGLLVGAVDPEPADDDPPLALVEPAEHPLDRLLHPPLGALVLVLVHPVVGRGLEHLLVAG